jgi:nucleoside 2-deoxyribosyltransferase
VAEQAAAAKDPTRRRMAKGMERLHVYMAGPPDADEYRQHASELLRRAGHVPIRCGTSAARTIGHEEEIVVGDLADVDSRDVVLADFSEPDEGTAMEAWYARSVGKPVVARTGGRAPHPWVVYVASSVNRELGEAVNALSRIEVRLVA